MRIGPLRLGHCTSLFLKAMSKCLISLRLKSCSVRLFTTMWPVKSTSTRPQSCKVIKCPTSPKTSQGTEQKQLKWCNFVANGIRFPRLPSIKEIAALHLVQQQHVRIVWHPKSSPKSLVKSNALEIGMVNIHVVPS